MGISSDFWRRNSTSSVLNVCLAPRISKDRHVCHALNELLLFLSRHVGVVTVDSVNRHSGTRAACGTCHLTALTGLMRSLHARKLLIRRSGSAASTVLDCEIDIGRLSFGVLGCL